MKTPVSSAALAVLTLSLLGATLTAGQAPPQSVQDEYATYELLLPQSGSFKTV